MNKAPPRLAPLTVPALLCGALAAGSSSSVRAAEAISEQDAHAIGVSAYACSILWSRWTSRGGS
jgi:hypothetical protein